MKMRWMAVAVVALLASACGGVVEEESTDVQAQHKNVDSDESIAGGGPCGTNYCGKGTFCCNASCGVCAPLGGGCLDVVCAVAQQPQDTHSATGVQQPPSEDQFIPKCEVPCPSGSYCCFENSCCARPD
jgi:hypothetical protein